MAKFEDEMTEQDTVLTDEQYEHQRHMEINDEALAQAKALIRSLGALAFLIPQERLGQPFEKVLYDNLWDLYAR